MVPNMPPRFEWIVNQYTASSSANGHVRSAFTIVPGRVYGARGPTAEFELYLEGERPKFGIAAIGIGLRHDTFNDTNREFTALQISIPNRPESVDLVSLVALKASQILHARPNIDHESLFQELYAYIRLVVQRPILPMAEQMGLTAELIFLERLLTVAKKRQLPTANALEAWKGYAPASRDFYRNSIAVEVKATGSDARHHLIGSIEQLQPDRTVGETEVYLFSVSLRSDPSIGFKLCRQVDQVVQLLDTDGQRAALLDDMLPTYGPSGLGYEHARLRGHYELEPGFSQVFIPALFRIDDDVKCLRYSDFVTGELPAHTVRVEYVLGLPNVITDASNPLPLVLLEDVLYRMLS